MTQEEESTSSKSEFLLLIRSFNPHLGVSPEGGGAAEMGIARVSPLVPTDPRRNSLSADTGSTSILPWSSNLDRGASESSHVRNDRLEGAQECSVNGTVACTRDFTATPVAHDQSHSAETDSMQIDEDGALHVDERGDERPKRKTAKRLPVNAESTLSDDFSAGILDITSAVKRLRQRKSSMAKRDQAVAQNQNAGRRDRSKMRATAPSVLDVAAELPQPDTEAQTAFDVTFSGRLYNRQTNADTANVGERVMTRSRSTTSLASVPAIGCAKRTKFNIITDEESIETASDTTIDARLDDEEAVAPQPIRKRGRPKRTKNSSGRRRSKSALKEKSDTDDWQSDSSISLASEPPVTRASRRTSAIAGEKGLLDTHDISPNESRPVGRSGSLNSLESKQSASRPSRRKSAVAAETSLPDAHQDVLPSDIHSIAKSSSSNCQPAKPLASEPSSRKKAVSADNVLLGAHAKDSSGNELPEAVEEAVQVARTKCTLRCKPNSQHLASSSWAASRYVAPKYKTVFVPSSTLAGSSRLHLQQRRCHHPDYEKFPRCRACVKKKASEGSCRWIQFRVFEVASASKRALGKRYSFATEDLLQQWNGRFEEFGTTRKATKLKPQKFPKLTSSDAKYALEYIRKPLCHLLADDRLAFAELNAAISNATSAHGVAYYRPHEDDSRQVCDNCHTTLFSSYWMCSFCGTELCATCIREWPDEKELRSCTYGYVHASPLATNHDNGDNSTAPCSKLVPVYKIAQRELDALESSLTSKGYSVDKNVESLAGKALMQRCECCVVDPHPWKAPNASATPDENGGDDAPGAASVSSAEIEDGGNDNEPLPAMPQLDEPAAATDAMEFDELPSLPVLRFDANEITVDEFREHLRRSRPIVVSGLLGTIDDLDIWTAEAFLQKYGKDSCTVFDCATNVAVPSLTLRDFFSGMIDPESKPRDKDGNPLILKLKDWPPHENFSSRFADLYASFMKMLPCKTYTDPEGKMNMAAYTKREYLPSDLGPKMYNAYASSDQDGGHGTTNLHMDMTDAINIMVHARPRQNHPFSAIDQDIAAVWDIYPPSASRHLRGMLIDTVLKNEEFYGDPIHDQYTYITSGLRKSLAQHRYTARPTDIPDDAPGDVVLGYRIYQRPGDAVFIPAGCAHQVCNVKDAIKVAMDFASPEHFMKSWELMEEFRALPDWHRRRVDILQVRNVAWFAGWACLHALQTKEDKSKQEEQELH